MSRESFKDLTVRRVDKDLAQNKIPFCVPCQP